MHEKSEKEAKNRQSHCVDVNRIADIETEQSQKKQHEQEDENSECFSSEHLLSASTESCQMQCEKNGRFTFARRFPQNRFNLALFERREREATEETTELC